MTSWHGNTSYTSGFSLEKSQWCGALRFSLFIIKNSRVAGDLRHLDAHVNCFRIDDNELLVLPSRIREFACRI